jgi:hypothetical protein
VRSIFFLTSFVMNSSKLSEENSDNELLEDFLKLSKISKNFNKELKNVKQEKESLIIKLSESHPLFYSLKYESTMMFNIIDTLENKLKDSEYLLEKFSSDNFKKHAYTIKNSAFNGVSTVKHFLTPH